MKILLVFVCLLGSLTTVLAVIHFNQNSNRNDAKAERRWSEAKQSWDYVNVRQDAFMFWWLYYTTASTGFTNTPLVLWLQGGPGGSSTGFGNFKEIGPLDVSLKPRNTTWLSEVSLLFIDNPVGTGYSYVTSDTAYSKDSHQIAVDLVSVMKAFLKKTPEFQKVPFYVFSESYGGKMTAAFAQELYHSISAGTVSCNFQGFAMGDSWISPLDSVLSWGPYLYATSIVDAKGLAKIDASARLCKEAIDEEKWKLATQRWSELENVVESETSGVNFYNILDWGGSEIKATYSFNKNQSSPNVNLVTLYRNHVAIHENDALSELMNGAMRKKLKIIPQNITWGGQSGPVFSNLEEDFMKDVTDIVDQMLNTSLKVVVYNGQLDLIVDSMGTDQWVQGLQWSDLEFYNNSPRKPFFCGPRNQMAGFVKQYKNFSFYWIMNAGHMVPSDNGEAALQLLRMVTQ